MGAIKYFAEALALRENRLMHFVRHGCSIEYERNACVVSTKLCESWNRVL